VDRPNVWLLVGLCLRDAYVFFLRISGCVAIIGLTFCQDVLFCGCRTHCSFERVGVRVGLRVSDAFRDCRPFSHSQLKRLLRDFDACAFTIAALKCACSHVWITLCSISPTRLLIRTVAVDSEWVYHETAADWIEAEGTCRAEGGNLASVHNYDEDMAFRTQVLFKDADVREVWLGGNDLNSEVP